MIRVARHVLALTLVLASVFAVAGPAAAQNESEKDETAVAELAKKHYKNKNFDMAARLYVRAYEMSKRPNLLFNAGRSRENNGERAEAIELYRQYVQVETDVALREEARARLEALQEKGDKPANADKGRDRTDKQDKADRREGSDPPKAAKDKTSGGKEKTADPIPAGKLELNKTAAFDKSGTVRLSFKLGPLTVNELLVRNMPTSSEVQDALTKDPNDNSRPKFQLGISNKGDVKYAIEVVARLETSDGIVLYSCDRKDTVDRQADNDHTTMCGMFASVKTRLWPKVALVRIILTARPD